MNGTRGHILPLMVMGILLGMAGPGHTAIQTPAYDDTSTPEILNPSWMASVPNIVSLSEVTMPGTHNSMALYGGSLSECNSWSLPLQLRAGIRFLDVRVRHVRGNLTIHHGISYQYAHFGDVLTDVGVFLRDYPTETVLMRLKETLSDTRDIYAAVVRYVHQYAHWDLLWHSREVPTIGEVRGKLIILQDFPGPDLGMRYGSLDIADQWKVSSLQPEEVEKKWRSISTHLEAAAVGNKNQMFLTYSSGASILVHPNALAKIINPHLHQYLTGHEGQRKRLGIVTMDFPGAKPGESEHAQYMSTKHDGSQVKHLLRKYDPDPKIKPRHQRFYTDQRPLPSFHVLFLQNEEMCLQQALVHCKAQPVNSPRNTAGGNCSSILKVTFLRPTAPHEFSRLQISTSED